MDDGVVDMFKPKTDPVSQLAPDYVDAGKSTTLRQLAESGLGDDSDLFDNTDFSGVPDGEIVLSASCGWNDKKNSCEDVGNAGVTKTDTADPHFIRIFPTGWKRTPGYRDALDGVVRYDATPIYSELEYTPCSSNKGCDGREHTGCIYFTGFYNDFRLDGENLLGYGRKYTPNSDLSNGHCCTCGGSCPGEDVVNNGKTPCRQRRCDACWKISDNCKAGSGHNDCNQGEWQSMCARKMDRSKSCMALGSVWPEEATTALYDGNKKGSGTPYKFVSTGQFNNQFFDHGHAQCSYPEDTLKTPRDLENYMKLAVELKVPNNHQFKDPLMRSFCTQLIDNTSGGFCQGNLVTGVPKVCSYFNSTLPAGTICRDWLEDVYTKGRPGIEPDDPVMSYDEIIRGHCRENPWLDECKCVRRRDDQLFNTLESFDELKNGNPKCWYQPCKSGLTNGMLRDTEIRDPECKSVVCANIFRTIDSAYNTIPGLKQVVNCNVDTGGGGGSTTPTTGTGNGSGINTDVGVDDTINRGLSDASESVGEGVEGVLSYVKSIEPMYLVAGLVGVAILLAIGIFVFFKLRAPATPPTPATPGAAKATPAATKAPVVAKAEKKEKKAKKKTEAKGSGGAGAIVSHLFSEKTA